MNRSSNQPILRMRNYALRVQISRVDTLVTHEFLHEAMRDVLSATGQPCTALYIADQIAKRGLWRRPSDGQFPLASQICWRVHSKKDWFDRFPDGRIALSDSLCND